MYIEKQLTVRTITCHTVVVDVEHIDLICAVKEKIAGNIGIPVDQQVFIFRGQCLEDNQTIGFYKILEKPEYHPFDIVTMLVYEKRLVIAVDNNETQEVKSYFKEISLFRYYFDYILYDPLDFASHAGHVGIVTALIDNGGCPSRDKGWKAPHLAACMGNTKVLEVLLSGGFDKDVETDTKSTILSIACASGHVDVVNFLLAAECNKESKDDDGYTPFSLSCLNGHLEVCK
jgi:hypothetical protein